METKIHRIGDYKYYYSRRDRTWLVIHPDGKEENGGQKEQAEFYINFLIKKDGYSKFAN